MIDLLGRALDGLLGGVGLGLGVIASRYSYLGLEALRVRHVRAARIRRRRQQIRDFAALHQKRRP